MLDIGDLNNNNMTKKKYKIYIGIFLHESGVLAASPDGLIDKAVPDHCVHFQPRNVTPKLLEIKCPFAAKEMTVTQAIKALKNFYIGISFK